MDGLSVYSGGESPPSAVQTRKALIPHPPGHRLALDISATNVGGAQDSEDLYMRMDKLTSKFQLALADAQSLATGLDHQLIEPVHVMVALLDQEGGASRHLLTQGGCAREPAAIPIG